MATVVRALAGSLILDARLRAGLTQRELARRSKVAQSTIATYEAGRRQPSLPALFAILGAAGFNLRVHLGAHDDHDETVDAWRRSMPAEDRAAWDAGQQRFVERVATNA